MTNRHNYYQQYNQNHDRREYYKEYYKNHINDKSWKKKRYERRHIYQVKVLEKFWAFMINKRCMDCGESDINVLDFHHQDGRSDNHYISQLIHILTWPRLSKEIEKCDIVCANCHKLRHWHEPKPMKFTGIKFIDEKIEIKMWFREYKKELQCQHCGKCHPAFINFHHKNPTNCDKPINIIIKRGSKQDILNEISKCDILCANCHRREHKKNKINSKINYSYQRRHRQSISDIKLKVLLMSK